MAKVHINDKGEAKPCHAHERPCKYGEENHYSSMEEAQAAQEAKLAAEHGTTATMSKAPSSPFGSLTVPEGLETTEAGVKRFQQWKQEWQSHWGGSSQSDKDEDAGKGEQAKQATYDGAPIPVQEDGGVPIPAGEYVSISTDGWLVFDDEFEDGEFEDDDFEDEEDDAPAEGSSFEEFEKSGLQAWQEQAWADTPPGAVGGAYWRGKPAYFMANPEMGQNHGYDGELLIPKDSYEIMKAKGFGGDDMYPVTTFKVEKNTVIYGDLGNLEHAPGDLHYDNERNSEAMASFRYEHVIGDGEEGKDTTPVLGSWRNHPLVKQVGRSFNWATTSH